MSPDLPTGTVSFLLTDIVGSTRLWQQAPVDMDRAIAHHQDVIGRSVQSHGGMMLKPRGEGDSTFSVFSRARDAVAAALDAQHELRSGAWPVPVRPATRMAVHTGEAVERDGDYFGPVVNRAARLRSV
ncbi:MAG TPA: adenylate/guanylate cyclase domain-containing protein, partial [Acidimicrobiales bacterium]